MRKLTRRLAVVSLLLSIFLSPLTGTFAADFKREVIYQIITDRFFDPANPNSEDDDYGVKNSVIMVTKEK